jgi:hypothetical protein
VDLDEVADAAGRLGARELLGKAACAARAGLPWLLCRRRTVGGVAAYFDLITCRFSRLMSPGAGLTCGPRWVLNDLSAGFFSLICHFLHGWLWPAA